MKKYLFAILFSLVFFQANTQVLKLRIGPVLSRIDWYIEHTSNSVYNNNYLGYSATLGIEYLHKKFFFLSSDIGFVNNGGKGELLLIPDQINPENSIYLYPEASLNWLTVNTVAKFKVDFGKQFSAFLGLGPRLDYLISYKEEVKFMEQFDKAGELQKVIYGMISTIGLNYNINRFSIGTEFQYNLAFNKLVEDYSMEGMKNNVSIRYMDFLFTCGYRLSK